MKSRTRRQEVGSLEQYRRRSVRHEEVYWPVSIESADILKSAPETEPRLGAPSWPKRLDFGSPRKDWCAKSLGIAGLFSGTAGCYGERCPRPLGGPDLFRRTYFVVREFESSHLCPQSRSSETVQGCGKVPVFPS